MICIGLRGINVGAAETSKKPVQIFMGGKQYRSFDNYRDDRLKKQWIRAIGQKEFAQLKKYLSDIQGFSDEEQETLSKNEWESYYAEYQEYLKSIKKQAVPGILTEYKEENNNSQDPMREAEVLLRELKAVNRDAKDIQIDPDKMKTIEIK